MKIYHIIFKRNDILLKYTYIYFYKHIITYYFYHCKLKHN